ncbi:MAG: NUDIX hydrolase [Acidobacteria bacterium]|nr:NUDIX hydrolase [Acidobacteriota bacterium]
MNDKGEVVRTERVFEGKLLKVDREEVVLPGGKRATLETIRHPGAAAALPFFDDGTVMLIRQYRHAAGGFILEVPAGKLAPGEPPADCIARELEEEIGYRPGRLVELGSILTTPGFTDEVIWLFEAHALEPGQLDLGEDEVIEPVRVPFDTAVGWVLDGTIRDVKSVSSILKAHARRR